MNKDFWEYIAKLEELAKKTLPDNQTESQDGEERYIISRFIAAANPVMIQEMIAEMRKLDDKNKDMHKIIQEDDKRIENAEVKLLQFGKEADWLAAAQNWDVSTEEPIRCPEGKEPSDGCISVPDCTKCWREAARKAVEKQCEI